MGASLRPIFGFHREKHVSRSRDRQIEIIKQRLLRRSTPRLQVSLLLLITGFAGFLTSFFLLHLGVIRMWVRYPVVILISYVVFLLLLRIWLWFRGRSLVLDVDPPSLNLSFSDGLTCGEGVGFSGGDAGGGGAGGSWGDGISSSSSVSSSDTSSSTRFDPDLDLEEGCLIVIAVVALIGGFVACFYVIYVAPALLADILVDGVLVAGLYRRVRKIEQRHWLLAAVRRTLAPAVLAAMFFAVAGWGLQKAVPEAHTIGQVWNHLTGTKR
jgi:hypothetical protein